MKNINKKYDLRKEKIKLKQSEKTKNTYNKILQAAIEEFAEKGYDNASLNTICAKNNISKGLIYHNFKNKDELYLRVVEECFKKLVKYLKGEKYSKSKPMENIKKLLTSRQEFFKKFENYQNIFFEVVLSPPNHLIKEIQEIRKEYDAFNIEKFRELLKSVKLRKGLTEEMAISYFLAYQEMFNGYFQNRIYNNKDLFSAGKEHDLKLLPILDIMLYGIVEDESENKKN